MWPYSSFIKTLFINEFWIKHSLFQAQKFLFKGITFIFFYITGHCSLSSSNSDSRSDIEAFWRFVKPKHVSVNLLILVDNFFTPYVLFKLFKDRVVFWWFSFGWLQLRRHHCMARLVPRVCWAAAIPHRPTV